MTQKQATARKRTHKPSTVEQQFFRHRDVGQTFGVSESQVRLWERDGLLQRVKLPGMSRAVRFARADVLALADRLAGQQ